MSVQVNYGAVKYSSIKAAAVAMAKKSGEPVERVYIRLYMRKRNGNKLWSKPRKYVKKETQTINQLNEQLVKTLVVS